MEVKATAKPSEPPESSKGTNVAEKEQSWRTKKFVEAGGREFPFKKKEVRFAGR